ncbi:MAG: hypothetical protein ACLQIB_17655 [Isosphaeraceae bacterium]
MNQGPRQRRRESRMNLGSLMVLIAGAALGLWMALPDLREMLPPNSPAANDMAWGTWDQPIVLLLIYAVGGMSLVGVPLLLWTARGRIWQAGRLLWFIQGTATWLLWPPMIYRRTVEGSLKGMAACYYHGTPAMALYVTIALLAGGYLRRSRRRRIRLSWQEQVGLLLGLVWACTGLYMISLYYRSDFLRK